MPREPLTMDTLLIDAARNGKLQEVCHLLQKGADVNATNQYGDSSLMKASWNGNTDVVQELLRHDGVDVNRRNVEGETALMLASCQGHINIVEALLKHGALDVYHRNNKQETA
jgi:ankyrin repeat protein